MKPILFYLINIVLGTLITLSAQEKTTVDPFYKVVISPHIEATLVQGNESSVTILESSEPEDKINIEVKGSTLRVYLDDAKETTKQIKVMKDGYKQKVPIYNGKVLSVLITYTKLEDLSVRGEQMCLLESLVETEKFKLDIYGESRITFNDVKFNNLDTDVYGESELFIKKGTIGHQKVTAYGEAIIDLVGVENKTTRLKAFGEAEFKIQSSERIKLTAYGEAKLGYKGNPDIDKGLSVGDYKIYQIN